MCLSREGMWVLSVLQMHLALNSLSVKLFATAPGITTRLP